MDYILWQYSNVEDEEEQDAVSICARPMKQKRLGMRPMDIEPTPGGYNAIPK